MNHPLQCQCGTIKGHVVRPGMAIRAVCYCKDCQAFAHFLERAGAVLDEQAGTAIVATLPSHVHFSQGLEALACMSLSDHGLLRWYASCCNTPIANTPRDFKTPYLGLIESCLISNSPSLRDSFGPVRMVLNTKYAKGRVKASSVSNLLALLGIMKSVIGARLSGAYKHNPFFRTESGSPVARPRELGKAERERFTKGQAAELQVLAGGGIAGPLRELAAQFESASGHKLVLRFGTTPELINMATTGGPFDLGVVPREVFKDAAARAQFASGPMTTIARAGLGVAVRAGAPKPDIGTPEALKQALLEAQSIAAIPASAAGAQMLRAFDRLGIGEAMKAKTRVQPGPAQLVETVAKGEAELGLFLINVLTAPGLDVVGPFPAELQQEIVFEAALGANVREAHAAKAFIAFLTTPAATAAIKAKGMNPG